MGRSRVGLPAGTVAKRLELHSQLLPASGPGWAGWETRQEPENQTDRRQRPKDWGAKTSPANSLAKKRAVHTSRFQESNFRDGKSSHSTANSPVALTPQEITLSNQSIYV